MFEQSEKTEKEQRKIANLIPFQAGVSGNPNGRPKKFVSVLKAQGYKLSEINDCIKTMLSMTRAQLDKAEASPQATMLEKMIISAINTAIKRGDLSTMETLVSRTYGKPKERIEISIPPEIEAARALYAALIENQGMSKSTAIKEVIKSAQANGFDLSPDDILNADTIG